MNSNILPSQALMEAAFINRDEAYNGIFYTGVRTTGIFCNPACTARKPQLKNIEFFRAANDALAAGYRPCKICQPLVPAGENPDWVANLMSAVDSDPSRRWTDHLLRQGGYSPSQVRRWFQHNYGITFHGYCRARRLGKALTQIKNGRTVTASAFEQGYESLSGFNDAIKEYFDVPPSVAAKNQIVTVTRLSTPLGMMIAGATDKGVCLLEFADRRMLPRQFSSLSKRLGAIFVPGDNALLTELKQQLEAYFNGSLSIFTVPLATSGTVFQSRVWDVLINIPHGQTASYADIAAEIGQPTAVRAVAQANGANKIAILIPCHRIIGSDGQLAGYGGGVWRKRRLLEMEGVSLDY
jgi:AraC family transcriptional regulator of adaptative response/methylated-DNA-[protein]-cysteine methyltransferase